jgi:HSP20 family protein
MKKRQVPDDRHLVSMPGALPIQDEKFPFPRFAAKMMHRALSEPVIDVFQTREEVVATIELPGVRKENISLKVSPSSLLLQVRQGHREERREQGHYEYSARFEGHSETVSLPAAVDSAKARATYKNGVLEVRVPKLEPGDAKAGSVKIN